MKNFEQLKEEDDMKIADWFTPEAKSYMHVASNFRTNFTIVRETEKAICVSVEWDSVNGEFDGMTNIWVPKSCIESRKEYFKAKAEKEARKQKSMDDGLARFMKLRQFCIDNKVISDGKRRYTTATLMKKIADKGLVY